ncbi:MAG: ABC transporter ATP-binding protein [Candidatus Marinimicrobia bacterium]|nr:ABC transporter ATP-binding protein [Candidatus Neomarinimicrobiota bacterium]
MIQLEDIYRVYDLGESQVNALNGVSCLIEENEYVSIMGQSGSGKSTLMNIIGALDTPTKGRYFLDGVEVQSMNDDRLSKIRNQKIGFVFQAFNLLPRSNALQNVELPLIYSGSPKKERTERAKEALNLVGLSDRMHHKPNELSGGQCQRVAVARALVNNPSILLADEPTGNLDSKTGMELMDVFDSLQKNGHTIVLVTHEEHVAQHANRIIRLLDGKISYDEKQI